MMGEYRVKHLINLGHYESMTVEQGVTFDIPEVDGSFNVAGAFANVRAEIDNAMRPDLERAAQCTSYDEAENKTYVYEWLEETDAKSNA